MALRAQGLSSSLSCAWLPVCIPFYTSCSDCFIKTILKATQPSVAQHYCSLFNQSPVSGQSGCSCPGLLCRGGFNTPLYCPTPPTPQLHLYIVLPLLRAVSAGMRPHSFLLQTFGHLLTTQVHRCLQCSTLSAASANFPL